MLFFSTGCHRGTDRVELTGEAQGTYYSIIYYDSIERNLQPAIDSLLAAFDQTVSLWEDNSLIRRINRNETDTLNMWLADLLQKSLEICTYTEGCFDCRVGRLVQAWGFSFRQQEKLDSSRIDTLLQVARGKVAIDTQHNGTLLIRKEHKETELDFNAIAQGYSVDLISQMLDSLGIENYLIDVGGEVLAHGCKPGGKPWSVGIEKPAEHHYSQRTIQATISLSNLSVVTSGNYRKYYEKDGIRYSHTIDPSTGIPVQHTLMSASVIDSAAWRADALATAIMVMGKDRALQFALQHPEDEALQRLYLIFSEGKEYKTYATKDFDNYINR